ncbi:unnamed protein product [Urochloa humidicola]
MSSRPVSLASPGTGRKRPVRRTATWKAHQHNPIAVMARPPPLPHPNHSSIGSLFNSARSPPLLIQLRQPSSRRFQQTPPGTPTLLTVAAAERRERDPAAVPAVSYRRRRDPSSGTGSGYDYIHVHASMDPGADPSPSRRSLKRRPPARSPELSPKAGGGEPAAAAGEGLEELIRRVEELEAAAARMRGEKEAAEEAARGLRQDLDAERASAETAASEAMLMIERLQREKAAAQMEARQFKRYAEGRADREREVQEELASLTDLAASYHSRLQSHGIDPDLFSDEDEEELDEEGEEVEQIDLTALEEERNGGDLSSAMELKAMVVDGGGEEEVEPSTPVEKEFEYTVDVRCASTMKTAGSVVVAEYVGEGNSGGLYARVEALEADRVALRREIAALRAERAQLVMAREMVRRLCWEMVVEQRATVKKTSVPASSFSVFRVCKWVLSVLFWRNRSSTAKYTFGLSTTFLGLLLLLNRSTMLSPWRRLPRPQR